MFRFTQGLLGLWHALVAGYITVTLIATVAAVRMDWDDAAVMAAKRAETKPLLGAADDDDSEIARDGVGGDRRTAGASGAHRNSTGSRRRSSGRRSASYHRSPRAGDGARSPHDLVDGFTESPFAGAGVGTSASTKLNGDDRQRAHSNYDSFRGSEQVVPDDGSSGYGSSARA